MLVLACLQLCTFSIVCVGQTKEELYCLDKHSYESMGNHPTHVNDYWVLRGYQLIAKLRKGEYPDLENRDAVIAGLVKLHGDPDDPDARKQRSLEMAARILNLEKITGDELVRLHKKNSHLAEQTLKILTPDFAGKIIRDELLRSLKQKYRNARTKPHLRWYLENDVVRQEIGITAEQWKEIQQAIATAKNRYEKESELHRIKFRILSDEFFSQTLAMFDDDQQKLLLDVSGEPIWFFAEFDPPFFASQKRRNPWEINARGDPTVFIGSAIPTEPDEKGKFVFEYDDDKLAELGFHRYDQFVGKLLSTDFVQGWLQLDKKQQALWPDFEKYLQERVVTVRGRHKDRIEELIAQQVTYPATLKNILTPQQLDDFRRLEYQARTVSRHQNRMQPSRFIPKNIELRKSQQGTLNSLFQDYGFGQMPDLLDVTDFGRKIRDVRAGTRRNTRTGESVRAIADLRHEIKKNLDAAIKKIMTPEQQRKYADLFLSEPNKQN